jgi:hypothetical protein
VVFHAWLLSQYFQGSSVLRHVAFLPNDFSFLTYTTLWSFTHQLMDILVVLVGMLQTLLLGTFRNNIL